jgi:hypothetical protein
VFTSALAELRAGPKRNHWMSFIFPQPCGLGHSSAATFYGIGSVDEVRAFLAHPTFGPRLEVYTQAVLTVRNEFGNTCLSTRCRGCDSIAADPPEDRSTLVSVGPVFRSFAISLGAENLRTEHQRHPFEPNLHGSACPLSFGSRRSSVLGCCPARIGYGGETLCARASLASCSRTRDRLSSRPSSQAVGHRLRL